MCRGYEVIHVAAVVAVVEKPGLTATDIDGQRVGDTFRDREVPGTLQASETVELDPVDLFGLEARQVADERREHWTAVVVGGELHERPEVRGVGDLPDRQLKVQQVVRGARSRRAAP
jgi:hypothetical protein